MALPKQNRLKPQFRTRLFNLSKFYQQPVARVSTAIILTVFAIVFFAAAAIRPTLSTIAQLIKKIEDQKQVKAQLDQKVAALSTAQQEYNLVESNIPLINQAVPANQDVKNLLTQVEAIASSLNLSLNSIQVNTISVLDPNNSTSNNLESLNFSVSLVADYNQLQSFTNRISNMSRIVTIDNIIFSPEDSGDNISRLDLTLQLKAYFSTNPESEEGV